MNKEQIKAELSKHPRKEDIDTNKFANNSEYLKIGAVVRDLHAIFGGYKWEIIEQGFSMDMKHYVVHGRLTAGEYVFDGIGAVSSDTYKNSKGKEVKFDPNQGVPKANSYAIKNASKNLGVRFGALLNKDVDANPTTEMDIYEQISNCPNVEALNALYKSFTSSQKKDTNLINALSERKEALTNDK